MPSIIKTKKNREKKHSKQVTYLFCALKGFLVFIIGSLLLGFLLFKSQNNSLTLYIFLYFVIALGGFISGFSAYRRLKGRGFINGVIASIVYCSFIFFVVILMMRFNVSAQMLLLIPICVLSGFLGGTVGANT